MVLQERFRHAQCPIVFKLCQLRIDLGIVRSGAAQKEIGSFLERPIEVVQVPVGPVAAPIISR
jgi:hypothetical protein